MSMYKIYNIYNDEPPQAKHDKLSENTSWHNKKNSKGLTKVHTLTGWIDYLAMEFVLKMKQKMHWLCSWFHTININKRLNIIKSS